MMELPEGCAEVSGVRAAEVPSAGITLDLQFCGLEHIPLTFTCSLRERKSITGSTGKSIDGERVADGAV